MNQARYLVTGYKNYLYSPINRMLSLSESFYHYTASKEIKCVVIDFIIHPCDPTVVIGYLIWPCDIAVHITHLVSHSSSLS